MVEGGTSSRTTSSCQNATSGSGQGRLGFIRNMPINQQDSTVFMLLVSIVTHVVVIVVAVFIAADFVRL